MKLKGPRAYPKDVLINDEEWAVRFARSLPHAGSPRRRTLGENDPSERTITLRLGLTRYETLVTFIHEAVHGMEYEYDFEIPHTVLNKLDAALAHFLLTNWSAIKALMPDE